MTGRVRSTRGFTLIEIMLTVAVLSAGIALIYRALLASLDFQTHLVHRLYAVHLLDQKAEQLKSALYFEDASLFDVSDEDLLVTINNRPLLMSVDTRMDRIGNTMRLMDVDVSLRWNDRRRDVVMDRRFILLGNDWEAVDR